MDTCEIVNAVPSGGPDDFDAWRDKVVAKYMGFCENAELKEMFTDGFDVGVNRNRDGVKYQILEKIPYWIYPLHLHPERKRPSPMTPLSEDDAAAFELGYLVARQERAMHTLNPCA